MYDIAIIGSGPAGYVAGLRGAQLGKKVCIIEKDKIGGVCLNSGCIPTKAILGSIDILHSITTAERFGINIGSYSADFSEIIRRKDTIVKKLTSGIEFLLKHNGVEIIIGTASIKELGCATSNCIKVGAKEIRSNSIMICTGSSPFLPFKIDHKNGVQPQIVSSDEALNFDSLPSRLLIIGAGAVGVEFATIFAGLGSKVTLVEMLPSILPEIRDKKIVDIIRKSLTAQSIEIIEGNKVEEVIINNGSVCSVISNGTKLITEKVIVACGRTLNSGEFENIGLEIKDKKIMVNNRMQTSIPGIYAAGDITGPPLLAHKASAEATIAVEVASGINSEMDYNAIPSCVFSTPEVAWVGKFEAEVPDAHTGEYRFQGIGKAMCIEKTNGVVKVVADKEYKIKGIQIVGQNASDLIPIGILAVKKELQVSELACMIYPHPTLSECLKEALLDVTHDALHKKYDLRCNPKV